MRQALGQLRALGVTGQVAGLAAIVAASALVELAGAVALVPLLQTLAPEPVGGVIGALSDLAAPLGLVGLLAVFVALTAARAGLAHWRVMATFSLEIAVVDRLRARAFSGLLAADWRALSRMRQSDNRALLVSTIDQVGLLVHQGAGVVALAVNLAALGLAAFILSPPIAAVALIAGVAIMLLYRGMRRRARDLGEEMRLSYEGIYAALEENLAALRVIKSFQREDEARSGVAASFADLRRTQRRYARDLSVARAALQLGGAIALALLAWWGIAIRGLPLAVLLPLIALMVRALPLLTALQDALQQAMLAAPGWAAVHRLIDRVEPEAEEPGTPGIAPRFEQTLILTGIGFANDRDQQVLHGLDLRLDRGEIVSITGPSGSGKSTLADILGGLVAPTEGTVAIDGTPLDAAARRAWRTCVAYVQQETLLAGDTVRANLAWGDPAADDAAMEAALHSAQAGFVMELPDGLDTLLGEAGRTLSGGERQRIALARALLRKPRLLILDEATGALDPETDAAIARAVADLAGRTTVVILGHRGALVGCGERHLRLAGGRLQ